MLPRTLPLLACICLVFPTYAVPTSTTGGNEIAISLDSYRYEEPGLMSLQGIKTGLDLRMTRSNDARRSFFRTELRFATGDVRYSSNKSGSMSGEPDWYLEGRLLAGTDLPQKNSLLSPYIGIGYRFLFNDGRGLTTSNAAGYRRESKYLYLPLGFTYMADMQHGNTLKTMVEYDRLLSGTQFTRLSDTGLGYSDINSKQSSGYGIKLRMTYATREWSVGPYLHYWNIAASEIKPLYRNGTYVGYGVEPENKTTEFGIEFGRPF